MSPIHSVIVRKPAQVVTPEVARIFVTSLNQRFQMLVCKLRPASGVRLLPPHCCDVMVALQGPAIDFLNHVSWTVTPLLEFKSNFRKVFSAESHSALPAFPRPRWLMPTVGARDRSKAEMGFETLALLKSFREKQLEKHLGLSGGLE